MFTLEDLFKSVFPQAEGISWDLGTVIVGMLMLSCIVIGFDIIKTAFLFRLADSMQDRHMAGMGSINALRRKANSHQDSAVGDYYQMQYKKALRDFEPTPNRATSGTVGMLSIEHDNDKMFGIPKEEREDFTLFNDQEEYSNLRLEKYDD